ncbi:MAG: D-alanyl-D-alanine carboxypeptidase/D-alanyl-D-alanine-endopeptidase, partial [Pyrinomonadaceae bacterium]|nr:D-alanyl-D-alanine carboxypeptidase/D-alanyl-D-alanine-endopeptidase [Pyrinomonadaceae bacterium]
VTQPTPPVAPPLTPLPGRVVSATVLSTAGAARTAEELRARIAEVTRRPELAPAMVAVKVASLDTGRTLYEENTGKFFMPASNMKIYTVAAALDRLSPDYRFKTSAYAQARPDAVGTLRGDLTIYGRGDPSFAARFNNGDYNKAIDDFASRIAASGVRRVEGDIVGDESYFTGSPLGSGWEWDDLQWWYGAEASALTVNDNALDLSVKPGAVVGAACIITTGPTAPQPHVTILNRTTTTARGAKSALIINRGLGDNIFEISGSLPLDDKGFTGGIAITRPAMMFIQMLRVSLLRRGITVTGRSRTVDARARAGIPLDTTTLVEIASLESPPLSVIAAQTLKPSQNLYTELILRTLGRVVGANSQIAGASSAGANRTSVEVGVEVVKTFLREAGVNPDRVMMSDGSGLSRHDLVTAEASVQLLTFMSKHRYGNVFREALPIAGVDGTLKNRMRGTLAANNLRAKTGTLTGAASLTGYVTSAAGERLVFSIMVNNYLEDDVRRNYIDPIAVMLAAFAGRS